ncbi:MAG: hypothetical protein HY974_02825 [Candidatus Kerfeldbacteria bacterium]|nr:hypothetical protein [Candidatus Kerfeldbacteria bacterium]
MMVKQITVIFALLTCLVESEAIGQETKELKLSGFGFWIQEIPRGADASLKLKHVWLIANRALDSNLTLEVIIAPQGPPKIIHNLSLEWRKPFAGIDFVKVGRFGPEFSLGTNYYRVDRNPTVLYSGADQVVVARSNGLQVAGTISGFVWKVAAFSGDRLGGNINTLNDGKWDKYLLGRYTFGEFLSCGLSQRLGPVHARNINFVGCLDSLQVEAEAITSKDSTNYSVLGIHKTLPWLTTLVRYENVKAENRITPGFIIHLPHDCDIKCNAVIAQTGLETVLGQFILRW